MLYTLSCPQHLEEFLALSRRSVNMCGATEWMKWGERIAEGAELLCPKKMRTLLVRWTLWSLPGLWSLTWPRVFGNLALHWTSKSNWRSEGSLELACFYWFLFVFQSNLTACSRDVIIRRLQFSSEDALMEIIVSSLVIPRASTLMWLRNIVKVILCSTLATAQRLGKLSPHSPQVNCH